MDDSKVDEYHAMICSLRMSLGRLGTLMRKDHAGHRLTKNERDEAKQSRQTYINLRNELEAEGVIDEAGSLTSEALRLELRLI